MNQLNPLPNDRYEKLLPWRPEAVAVLGWLISHFSLPLRDPFFTLWQQKDFSSSPVNIVVVWEPFGPISWRWVLGRKKQGFGRGICGNFRYLPNTLRGHVMSQLENLRNLICGKTTNTSSSTLTDSTISRVMPCHSTCEDCSAAFEWFIHEGLPWHDVFWEVPVRVDVGNQTEQWNKEVVKLGWVFLGDMAGSM